MAGQHVPTAAALGGRRTDPRHQDTAPSASHAIELVISAAIGDGDACHDAQLQHDVAAATGPALEQLLEHTLREAAAMATAAAGSPSCSSSATLSEASSEQTTVRLHSTPGMSCCHGSLQHQATAATSQLCLAAGATGQQGEDSDLHRVHAGSAPLAAVSDVLLLRW